MEDKVVKERIPEDEEQFYHTSSPSHSNQSNNKS